MEGFEREVIGERRVRGKKAPGVERLVLGTVDKGLTGTNTQNVHEVGSVGGGGLRIQLSPGMLGKKSVFTVTSTPHQLLSIWLWV